jgi:hypothetical protein
MKMMHEDDDGRRKSISHFGRDKFLTLQIHISCTHLFLSNMCVTPSNKHLQLLSLALAHTATTFFLTKALNILLFTECETLDDNEWARVGWREEERHQSDTFMFHFLHFVAEEKWQTAEEWNAIICRIII